VVAKKRWGSVHVWTTLSGAELAHKDKPERIESPIFKKFGNAMSLIKDLKERGATFGVCPPCAEYFGSKGDNKLDFFAEVGGDWLMENIQNAWVLWM
jgi:predicted peroxiredoxin